MTPGSEPANVMVAPNSPSARVKQSTAPAAIPGATSGTVTSRNTCQRLGTERRRGGFGATVGGTERPLHREHQERHRDERLGEHHRARRVRDAEAGVREELPDQAAAAEQQQQGDAADDGRQHERHRDRRPQQAARHERPLRAVREQHRERHPEHQAQQGRQGRRQQRHPERLQHQSVASSRGNSAQGARITKATSGNTRNARAIAATKAISGLRRARGAPRVMRSGCHEPGGRERVLALFRQDEVHPGLGGIRIRCLGEHGDRVVVDHIGGLGNDDALDLVARRLHVGDVDQAGIGLAELDLGEYRFHVVFECVGNGGDASRVQQRLRCRTAGDGRIAQRDRQVGLRQVGQAGDPGGVARGHDQLECVGGEDRGVAGVARIDTVFMVGSFAAANTSAGALWVIWVARSELPP